MAMGRLKFGHVLLKLNNNNFVCYLLNDVYIRRGGSNNLIKYGNYYFNIICPYGGCDMCQYDIKELSKKEFINKVITRNIFEIYTDEFLLEGGKIKDSFKYIIGMCKNRIRTIKIDKIL